MSERKSFARLRLDERLRQWLGSPQEHALRERLRQWLGSPQEHALREKMRGLGIKIDLTKIDLTPPPRKRRRAKGAGRRSKLTAEQIEHGRTLLRHELANDPRVAKHAAAAAVLRSRLNLKNDVTDDVLKRQIIRPVLRGK
jgi:hypothetical protein